MQANRCGAESILIRTLGSDPSGSGKNRHRVRPRRDYVALVGVHVFQNAYRGLDDPPLGGFIAAGFSQELTTPFVPVCGVLSLTRADKILNGENWSEALAARALQHPYDQFAGVRFRIKSALIPVSAS